MNTEPSAPSPPPPALDLSGHTFGVACEMIFPDKLWHGRIAAALKVDTRTVRRWHSGTKDIADGVWLELAGLLEKLCSGRLPHHLALQIRAAVHARNLAA